MNKLKELNNIKDLKEYYNQTKPFYKNFCLEKKSKDIDIFPYKDISGDVMLDINSSNTHSEIIKDNIYDTEFIIGYLEYLRKEKINIIPFVFDYNINCYPRGWDGDGGNKHPIFQTWNQEYLLRSYNM